MSPESANPEQSDVSDELTPEIASFLAPYSVEIVALAAALRRLVRTEAQGATELVYDAYNAVAMGYSFTGRPSDGFCHIAVYAKWVNLGFNFGAGLPDPNGLLQGKGARVRHLRMSRIVDIDQPHVKEFLREAMARAAGFEAADGGEARSVVRAVYPTRRRPASGAGDGHES
jgi:hypothetical protein